MKHSSTLQNNSSVLRSTNAGGVSDSSYKTKHMPQVIFKYDPAEVTAERLLQIGEVVRPLVADAASTDQAKFTKEDIEWDPQPYHPGAIGVPRVAIELRTIGFPERKLKLNKERVLKLKTDIFDLAAEGGYTLCGLQFEQALIWVQFIDPDGVHV